MSTADAQERMIEQQVRAWDVLESDVLELFRKVPRERFVPEPHRYLAYADTEIALAGGQHMLRPSVAGRLLQALALRSTDSVLEIGSGSGFLTACLRSAAAAVRAIEIFPELVDLTNRNLASFGLRDIAVVNADAWDFDSGERYDAIAVTASMPLYDARFERQLTLGGRLFVVVGELPVMEARLIRRTAEDAWATTSLFETVIDPLVNAPRPPHFTF